MKNRIILIASLSTQLLLHIMPTMIQASAAQNYELKHPLLTNLDKAGFFDRALYDIIVVRQKIKNLVHGNYVWNGYQISLTTSQNKKITVILRRPELLYGATFVILPIDFADLASIVTPEYMHAIQAYKASLNNQLLSSRQNNFVFDGYFTGSYAEHPLTKKMIPIYVSDYVSDQFDTRNGFAHLGIPAHHSKDFEFAKKHGLEMKVVVKGKSSVAGVEQPMIAKDGKTLVRAYIKEDDDIEVCNSGSCNGNYKVAQQKIAAQLLGQNTTKTIAIPVVYPFAHKKYSLDQLKAFEDSLYKENKHIAASQKEDLDVLMNYAQADLLEMVEPFLLNIHAAKDLMIELIQQSCQLRKKQDSYLFKWSQLKTNESERIVFKRDILTFTQFVPFAIDLVNFLGDFASSCPSALHNLKRHKK